MNYKHIENLVMQSKHGDIRAKETLANEFTPLILNLSKRCFINSYEFEDIRNECYKTLFKCVGMYNPDNHRFVAYATNAIKNSVNNLIRISVRRSGAEGPGAYILDDKLESILSSTPEHIDDIIIGHCNKSKLRLAIKNLSLSEQQLINYVYFKGNSLKEYSDIMDIPYSTAVSKKLVVLNKLRKGLKGNSTKGTFIN